MKILVTGTAGFIGFHLAKKLLERGDEVIGLDNINDYYDVNLKYGRLRELGIDKEGIQENHFTASSLFPKHKFIKLDLSDREKMENLFKEEKFDAVCNLAAQAGVRYSIENPNAYIDSNVVGFMNILEGCRHFGVKNLSFASSSSVYGLNKSQPFKTSDHTDHQVSIYAATKKSNEMMAHTYAHLYGIQATGLRFFTVYGPWGRPDMAPMLFTDAILNDRPINVFNHGNMSRDFTYIDDIVDGIIKVIDNPAMSNDNWNAENPTPESSSASYKIYNIGNNAPLSLMEFIETIEESLGKVAEKNYMPMQDGDVISTYADVDGLIKEFEYVIGRDHFDKFIQKYTGTYQFQSLTTEAFLTFLRGELPEVFEKVNIQSWIYEPGLTDERRKPQSALYDEVQEVLAAYKAGTRPTKEQVAGWHRYQILSFLQALPKQIPVDDCRYLEDTLELVNKNDANHYSFFFATCINSGHQEILPRVEEFLGKNGRMLYVLPVFRAMIGSDWAKKQARRILEEVREQQHLITVHVVDKLLTDAGL